MKIMLDTNVLISAFVFGGQTERLFYKGGFNHMSTLEKTITLLREMPEQSLESLYDFIRSIWIQQEVDADPVDISKSVAGYQVL